MTLMVPKAYNSLSSHQWGVTFWSYDLHVHEIGSQANEILWTVYLWTVCCFIVFKSILCGIFHIEPNKTFEFNLIPVWFNFLQNKHHFLIALKISGQFWCQYKCLISEKLGSFFFLFLYTAEILFILCVIKKLIFWSRIIHFGQCFNYKWACLRFYTQIYGDNSGNDWKKCHYLSYIQ